MREYQCSQCGRFDSGVFGKNFCISCGARMIEITRTFHCSNPECRMYLEKTDFPDISRFCGECGAPVAAGN